MERNTRNILILLISMIMFSLTKASDEDFACCTSSSFIFQNACFDPNKNTISDLRIVCNKDWGNVTVQRNFTIDSGKMIVKLIPELPALSFTSDLICHGNEIDASGLLENSTKVLIFCNVKNDNSNPETEDIFVYCSIISVVFLIITAIIYASLRELRDLFGWSIINFCVSLALGNGFYSFLRLVTPDDMASCAAQGFLTYFFLIAGFFWSNSISIQVLNDIRRPATSGLKELKFYALYSWCTPGLLTIIMAIVNFHPGDHQKPGIGLNHCWFLDTTQQWYYMYSVMSILLLINLGIFVYIATIIWRLTFSSTPVQVLKFKLWMTLKLILLMGLPWILQMISAAIENGHVIFLIIDIFTGLQGLAIFLVLVIRKRVVKAAHAHGWLDCCSGPVERWLATGHDDETNVVAHTDVPLHDEFGKGNRM